MSEAALLAYHLMSASLAAHQCRFDQLPQGAKARIQEQADRALLLERLVLASPIAAEVMVPASQLEKSIDSIKARYDGQSDFTADLARNGMMENDLECALARELKADAVLECVANKAEKATDAEAREWYDAHPERFSIGETRQVRHILITINEEIEENRREASRERIEKIRDELDGSLGQFADLALRYSECPSALNGGILGTVPRGKLYKELDDVLFAMDSDAISEVLESEAGYHILYCEAVIPGQTASFEEAALRIKDAIDKKRRSTMQKAFIAALLKAEASKSDEKIKA